ncbi:MAG: ornithine carbamoyltransferase [Dissulfuribacterales bacterium]
MQNTFSKHLRSFLRIADFETEVLNSLLDRAFYWKNQPRPHETPARGKVLGMLFEKPSTRTRISFEAAMYQLGGNVSFMTGRDLQIGRGEPLKDTARVLSRYIDCLAVRTFGQKVVEELAAWSDIPVINALSDMYHPCQILSDIMTVMEHKGRDVKGLTIAWIGDGNNMANSWIELAVRLGVKLHIACPSGYEPDSQVMGWALGQISDSQIMITHDPKEAIKGADVVNTDVWASMGQESEAEKRKKLFTPYQINAALLSSAAPDAIILHCLPAHRGEEITEDVLEGPRSVVWDQAENKMHIHKAILEWAMGI